MNKGAIRFEVLVVVNFGTSNLNFIIRQRLFARHQAELAALDADQEKSIDVESSTFLPTNPTRLKTVLHPLQVDHLESVKAQAEIGSAPLERLPSEFRTVLVDLDQFSSATDNDDKLSLLELGIHLGRERTDFLKKLKDEEQELRLFQQEEREPIQRHISRKHDAAKVEVHINRLQFFNALTIS